MRTRHDDPLIPDDVTPRDLDKVARNELKTLNKENADEVARHLVMTARLIDDDPELAHQHAVSASRRAGRIGVVRETLAITAYRTGDFALALRELRTYRRITGSNEQLALMIDSERGMGRPERALEAGRSVERSTLSVPTQVSVAIAMSGARLDLGQPEAALTELEIPQLNPDVAYSYSPDLFDAYAEVLEELGHDTEAATWRQRAERADAALGGDVEDEIEVFEVEDLEDGELSEVEDLEDGRLSEVEDLEDGRLSEVEDLEDGRLSEVEDLEDGGLSDVEDVEDGGLGEVEDLEDGGLEDLEDDGHGEDEESDAGGAVPSKED
ncbi:tetratricopeptide repeat protein [Herbiconiux sp. YIM B11900]|uniref:tetratricopeptide repeat protein n=1 Tax=Herbiconiux sp. YIM B11900 TaxID=3404131 RepID=UPI003F852D9C